DLHSFPTRRSSDLTRYCSDGAVPGSTASSPQTMKKGNNRLRRPSRPAIGGQRSMSIGPIRLTIICAIALSAVIASGTGFFLSTLHSKVLLENQRELANTALILARHIESV